VVVPLAGFFLEPSLTLAATAPRVNVIVSLLPEFN
jgi:hypothetical protein